MVFGTIEVVPIEGTLVEEFLPIAASQSLVAGDIIYQASGKVTKWLAAGADGTTAQGFYGVVAEQTFSTVNGVSTAFAVDTMVRVIPFWQKCYLKLPSFGTAPVLGTHICAGANTTGFVIRNDGGIYKVNLSTSANAVVRPFAIDWGDGRDAAGRPKLKSTFAVGDRIHCAILDAAKQVIC